MINVKRQEDAFGKIKKKTVESKIKDIFSISAGGDIDQKLVYSERTKDNNVPIYANSLINNGLYGYTSNAKITDESITVTGRGSIGHAKYRKESYYPIVRLLSLISKEKIDYKYMEENINMINILQESTGVPQLTAPQLGSYKISVHEIKIQEKIGKHLTAIDELIQKQEDYVEKLKIQKQAYSQRIFNQKEVVYKTLGKLCTIKYGYTPSTANSENFDGGIPWVSVSDMDRKVIKNTKKTLSTIGENKNKLIKKGTLIMSFKLTVGKLAFVGEDMYSNEAIANFTKLNSISAMYLYYALENTNIEKYGSQAAQGVTLNTELLKSIQVPITPNPEKVAVLLSTIDQKIELEKEKLELLKKKKKYYLNKIFS